MTNVVTKQQNPQHLSGIPLVTGYAEFIGDANKPQGMLYAKVLISPYAHAKILNIDVSEAKKFSGVVAVVTAADIPGANQIGHTLLDEPLLPSTEVMHVGQPVVMVVASTPKIAREVLKLIKVEYEILPAILTIEDALAAKSFYVENHYPKMECGDIEQGFKEAEHIVEGEVETGAQEHAYLETQRCWAIPGDDNNINLYSATQSTAEVQEIAARVLGIASKDVTVDVKRLGGAFGGKERTATLWACLAALAAYKTKKPIEIKLDRYEDISFTGKRHPFKAKYKVGFNADGKIIAYQVFLASNGGAFADLSLPILERSMFHADNAYYLPNARITGVACKTNLPPNTAFRGFGAPQGIFTIESVIEKISEYLQLDSVKVREVNLYQENQKTPYGQQVCDASHTELFARLKEQTQYEKLLAEVTEFNRTNTLLKRGIGVVPVKFGISFTASFLNQASALLWIYTDGTISLSHGGVEMGQEVNTKVAQVVARELGININRIRVESSNTKRTGNASPTAASTGADMNGYAALNAAKQIKTRLAEQAVKLLIEKGLNNVDVEHLEFANDKIYDVRNPKVMLDFAELVHHVYFERVALGAHGFYKTPGIYFDREKGEGHPFYYYVFGVALAQVEVDVLTGAHKLLKVHIVHENARSLNQDIDHGQISGAFFQGYGYCTMEEQKPDAQGRYMATTFSTYKIPTFHQLPKDFAIELYERDRKCASVFGSKAIGEPPFIYGLAAYFAIKYAITTLQKDKTKTFTLRMPATPEAVLLAVEEIKKGNWDQS